LYVNGPLTVRPLKLKRGLCPDIDLSIFKIKGLAPISKRLRQKLQNTLKYGNYNYRTRVTETALNASVLFWNIVFGSVGFGFFIYGKKQGRAVPMVCGLALMIFPYFVSNLIIVVVIGFALIAFTYFVRF